MTERRDLRQGATRARAEEPDVALAQAKTIALAKSSPELADVTLLSTYVGDKGKPGVYTTEPFRIGLWEGWYWADAVAALRSEDRGGPAVGSDGVALGAYWGEESSYSWFAPVSGHHEWIAARIAERPAPTGGTSGALSFGASCTTDADCATGLCFSFNAKGKRCTKTCTSDEGCLPEGTFGCSNKGVCRVAGPQ